MSLMTEYIVINNKNEVINKLSPIGFSFIKKITNQSLIVVPNNPTIIWSEELTKNLHEFFIKMMFR